MKQKRISRLTGLVLALMLMLTLAGCGAAGSDLPSPVKDSSVVDQADVLSDDAEALVNQYSGALQSATGAQIGVLTVTDSGEAKLGSYAKDVFKAWGIGDAKKQNGVLLVLVTGNGGDYWCVQGKGLKKEISSDEIGQMLATYLEPGFASGDFSAGVSAFVEAMGQRVASAEGATLDLAVQGSTGFHPQQRGSEDASQKLLILGGVFLVLCVVLVCMALLRKPASGKNRPAAAASRKKSRPAAARSSAVHAASRHKAAHAAPRRSGSRPASSASRSTHKRS